MTEREDAERELYGTVILLTQAWMALLDSLLRPDGLSARQWMLLAVIEDLGPEPPTLSEAASRYNASHQAVKNLAVRLEREGFLEIRKDTDDRRSLRLHLTQRHREFWSSRAADHQARFTKLFEGVETSSLELAGGVLHTLLATANETRYDATKASSTT